MSMQLSGTIVAVINIGEFIDESTLTATFGNRTCNNDNIGTNDVSWFNTIAYSQGTDVFLNLYARNDIDKLLPGLYLVKGYMVGERETCGYDDKKFNSRFNIELLEKLPDYLPNTLNVLSHYVPHLNMDLVDIKSLIQNILSEQKETRKNSIQLLGDLFSLLDVIYFFDIDIED